jgi:hypothetical protein
VSFWHAFNTIGFTLKEVMYQDWPHSIFPFNMSKTAQDIEDINFIIEEIIRFRSMEWTELKQALEGSNDGLCTIPHPDPEKGQLICGRAAYNRFYRIAERHLATEKSLQANFSPENFAGMVLNEFVRVFLKEMKEVNQRFVNKMLSAAMKKLKAKQKSLTHYIPCVVLNENQPEEFNMGPVRFCLMKKFLQDQQENFESTKITLRDESIKRAKEAVEQGLRTPDEVITPEMASENAKSHVESLSKHFSKFTWVAEVSIPECDEDVSRKRAEATVEAALNILKIFFGPRYGMTLRQGHAHEIPAQTGNLTRDEEGLFNISLTYNPDELRGGADWFQKVLGPHNFYLTATSSTLYTLINPERSTPLGQRFVDALSWYGQAVIEPMESAKIVKYVAALERLTITKDVATLNQTVSTRTALLTYYENKEDKNQALKEAKKKALKIYDWRSKLMHGSGSPFDKKLEEISDLAETITRRALLRGIDLFFSLGHELKRVATDKDLEEKYRELESALPQE